MNDQHGQILAPLSRPTAPPTSRSTAPPTSRPTAPPTSRPTTPPTSRPTALTGTGRRRLAQAAPGHAAAARGLLIDVLTAEQLSAVPTASVRSPAAWVGDD